MRRSPWLLLATVSAVVASLFVAAWGGAVGPLLVCGSDGAAVCVAWPAPAAVGLYVAFVAVLVGLVICQLQTWRGVSIDRRELVVLLGILLAALVVRLWRIDLAFVGYD